MVSNTPRPHLSPGKDTVPILQEAGWATGPVWTGAKSRLNRDLMPDRPARNLYIYIYIYIRVFVCVYVYVLEIKTNCLIRNVVGIKIYSNVLTQKSAVIKC